MIYFFAGDNDYFAPDIISKYLMQYCSIHLQTSYYISKYLMQYCSIHLQTSYYIEKSR